MRNKKLIILFSVLMAITLLVVFNSVLFSVQHVNAYCANRKESDCEESRNKVLASHKIRKGSSIFFVNESKVIKSVQASAADVRVLNVERKFPNRVYINYVEIKEYVRVTSGTVAYICGNDMRVLRRADVGSAETDTLIDVKYNGTLPDLQVGDTLAFTQSSGINTPALIAEIFSALERLDYYDTVIDLFCEIDLTGNFIVLTTRLNGVRGMQWEIQTADNLFAKLRLAMSVYLSENALTDAQRRAGTLVVAGDKVFYRAPSGGMEQVSV